MAREARSSAIARGLLVLAVLGALSAGGWGFLSYLASPAPPARVGETVPASGGGHWRVDAVTPERMAAMQQGKFAASGMNMSSMGMDMAPEGFERFAVGVTLIADAGPLSYSPDDFRVSGEGLEGAAPIRPALPDETLPANGAVSGTLVFQVPEEAKDLSLSFKDGRPVALEASFKQGEANRRGGDHGH